MLSISENNAKTLAEAGILYPNAFPKVTEDLEMQKILIRTKDKKYYLNK